MLRTTCAIMVALVLLIDLCTASDPGQGRYTYSLTTFDPTGKLGQVESALLAAEQGTPVVAFVHSHGVILAAPQFLPSFAIDDGTSRFSLVTPEILMTHSGLTADGRMLVAAAQRMAVEHEYTFDEPIKVEILLEELSLLFQEYTIKPGARPFGASLVVAHVPQTPSDAYHDADATPTLYKIDPSGNVAILDDCSVIHGRLERTDLVQSLQSIQKHNPTLALDDVCDQVVDAIRQALRQQAFQKGGNMLDDLSILTAMLGRDEDAGYGIGFCKRRYNTHDEIGVD